MNALQYAEYHDIDWQEFNELRRQLNEEQFGPQEETVYELEEIAA